MEVEKSRQVVTESLFLVYEVMWTTVQKCITHATLWNVSTENKHLRLLLTSVLTIDLLSAINKHFSLKLCLNINELLK